MLVLQVPQSRQEVVPKARKEDEQEVVGEDRRVEGSDVEQGMGG